MINDLLDIETAKIMVVDDEPFNLEIIGEGFRISGFTKAMQS